MVKCFSQEGPRKPSSTAPCTFPSHIIHYSPKHTRAAATQAPGAGAQRDAPVLTRVCCYIHSRHIREPHPELCFKCKQAAAWSFPCTCFTPCINSSADYPDFKIGDNRESPTMLLAPAVSYIFALAMRFYLSLPHLLGLCKFLHAGILCFFQVIGEKHSLRANSFMFSLDTDSLESPLAF